MSKNERFPSSLLPLLVDVSGLTLDPANARRHPERNIETIKGSLARFGQQKPIVVDAAGVVIAGNGTLQAARLLGWDTIAAVRSALTGADRAAFGIADNKTAELAEWDEDALNALVASLGDDAEALAATGFSAGELASTDGPRAEDFGADAAAATGQFGVIVMCRDEAHQRDVYDRLRADGHECKVVTT